MLVYLGFHSDAQILLLPYSDSVDHTDNYDDLVRMLQELFYFYLFIYLLDTIKRGYSILDTRQTITHVYLVQSKHL
jgi:hypothetical protein